MADIRFDAVYKAYMGLDIDIDALYKAHKGLIVLFISLITFINLSLIYIVSSKIGYKQSPKWTTLTMLSVGDLILALYALVIVAVKTYNPDFILYCAPFALSLVYNNFFIHFLYGIGLLALAIELLIRHKRTSAGHSTVLRANLWALIPWCLALVIVFPLNLVGADWDNCDAGGSLGLAQARFYISVIVPASLAIIASIIVALMNLTPVHATLQGTLYSLDNVAYKDTVSRKIDSKASYGTKGQYPNLSDSSNNQTFPATNSVYAIYPQPQVYEYNPTFPANYSQSPTSSNPRQEKLFLLIVSIIHFCLVVPRVVFALSVQNWNLSPSALLIIGDTLTWISDFRSIVTPLIWIVASRN